MIPVAPVLVAQGRRLRRDTPRLPDAASPWHGTVAGPRPLSLLVLGDSTAAGVGADTQDDALPGHLGRELAARTGRGVQWRAIGENGADARELIERYSISVPDLRLPVRLLSGGNLQKIVLARELASGPRALLAVHPTRGLDIGAAGEVRAALLTMRDCGAAVLLISEDLDEILALGDRVAVMHRGRLSGAMRRGEAHRETIGLLMTGQGPGAERVEAEG